MKAVLTEIDSYTRELDIRVSWDELKDQYNALVQKYHSQYQRQGFRKGKVPMAIFKKDQGAAIDMEFTDEAMNKYYFEALHENNLTPINRAVISHFHFHENEDFHFKAKFEVIPKFNLPDYQKNIKVQATRYQKTDRDVEVSLENLRGKHVIRKSVNTGAEEGHVIRGDFQVLDESGYPVAGQIYKDEHIKLGEGAFTGEVSSALQGAKTGDKVRVKPVFDKTPVFYEVTVNDVMEEALPELNDEFAKSVRQDVENLDELKKIIESEIQAELDKAFRSAVEDGIIRYFLENTQVDIPASMKENYLQSIIEDEKKRAQPGTAVNEGDIRKQYDKNADNTLKWYLIRDELIKAEKIEVTSDQVDAELEKMGKAYNLSLEKIKSIYNKEEDLNRISDDIGNRLLFDRLISLAKVKESVKSTDELREKE